MSDLKILEKDGYFELENVSDAVRSGSLRIGKLWESVAQADTAQAAIHLFEAGFDLTNEDDGSDVQVEQVKDVIVISEPDDISGENYRIWVKVIR